MKRISIDDFNGGIVNAVDPQVIPDNACVDILNYEYLDYTGLKKRKDVEFSELNDANIKNILSFAVWYPNRKLAGMVSDKIFIVHVDKNILITYKTATGWALTNVFSDLLPDFKVSYYTGYSRVLIADGYHPGRFIQISKELVLQYDDLGIEAPRYLPTVSEVGADNTYAEVGQDNTGMTIERGNILQYCYTVEDKYGMESNPSPVVTQSKMMFKYPDASTPTGYKWYWRKSTVSGFRADQYKAHIREKLKYFNIYRRDTQYLEGTVAEQFHLVYRKAISFGTNETYNDTSQESYGDISYTRGKSPASDQIIESSGVVYLVGVKSAGISFPFDFDRVYKINITNDNSIDYVNAPIGIKLLLVELGIDNMAFYIANPHRLRIFYKDLITPIPVIYASRSEQNTIVLYAKVPVLDRNSLTTLYLCLAEYSDGITDTAWDSYRYGKWFDVSGDWSQQEVFDRVPRIRNSNVIVQTAAPYDGVPTNYAINLANGNAHGTINQGTLTQTTISYPLKASELLDGGIRYESYFAYNLNNMSYEIDDFENGLLYQRVTENAYSFTVYLDISAPDLFSLRTITPPLVQRYQKRLFQYGRYHLLLEKSLQDLTKLSLVLWDGDRGYSPHKYQLLATFPLTTPGQTYNLRICFSVNSGRACRLLVVNGNNNEVLYMGGKTLSVNFNLNDHPIYNIGVSQNEKTNDTIKRFEIIANSYLVNREDMMRGIYFYPQYLTAPIGEDILTKTFDNDSITIEPVGEFDLESTNEKNRMQWSDVTGYYFNSLDFVTVSEQIKAIVAAPSFLKQQYQNTVIVMTRNTVNRVILSDDLTKMAQRPDNVIPEYASGGLYAEDSLVQAFNGLLWLSESGVLFWNPDGIRNISRGIIDIPEDPQAKGCYCAVNMQYWLYSSGVIYVYHLLNNAWTRFDGISIAQVRYLNLGEDTANKLLILDTENNFVEYPGANVSNQYDYEITTKQFRLDNYKPFRFRCRWDRDTVPNKISAYSYNSLFPNKDIQYDIAQPQRYEWLLLPTGFWGEYIQFKFEDVQSLTNIELDIREGV